MATFLTANRSVELPFFCDFEDTVQNALWSLENGSNPNAWFIGPATHNGGANSLYVSGDNGVSNSYTVGSADAVDYAFIDNSAVVESGEETCLVSVDFHYGVGGDFLLLRIK